VGLGVGCSRRTKMLPVGFLGFLTREALASLGATPAPTPTRGIKEVLTFPLCGIEKTGNIIPSEVFYVNNGLHTNLISFNLSKVSKGKLSFSQEFLLSISESNFCK